MNMAGYVASNVLEGNMDIAYWYDIEQADLDKTIILDVTEPYERSFGFIEGSVNIPLVK